MSFTTLRPSQLLICYKADVSVLIVFPLPDDPRSAKVEHIAKGKLENGERLVNYSVLSFDLGPVRVLYLEILTASHPPLFRTSPLPCLRTRLISLAKTQWRNLKKICLVW